MDLVFGPGLVSVWGVDLNDKGNVFVLHTTTTHQT